MKNVFRSLFIACCVFGAANLSDAQWVQTNGPYGGFVVSLAGSGSNLFAGTNRGVFLSTNNGAKWTAINNGLTDTDVRQLALSGTNLFAGTNGGVFLSTNNGTDWAAVNSGLTSTDVLALAESGTDLIAGTLDGGVWRRPLAEIVTSVPVVDGSRSIPTHFSLDQNYPNPFNPATTITYRMNQTSKVLLKVFNPIGVEVATLVDGTQAAGHHDVKFDATNLPSGVYFYRIQDGSLNETRRMVLLK